MKSKWIIFLLGVMLTSCASSGLVVTSIPTTTATSTSLPKPTFTSAPAITATQTTVTLPPGREIIFATSEGKDFTGTAYGEGATAIILANMSIGGAKQWDPFVAAVDKQKFTTLTFDYRSINDVDPDMALILDWLKEEGFSRAVCIGASLGTKACSSIAREPEIAGLVLIAGSVHHATVAEAIYPKLFVAGAQDIWAFDIQQGYEQAAEPKTLLLFEDNRAHGTDLFHSGDANEFLNLLVDFVNELANP